MSDSLSFIKYVKIQVLAHRSLIRLKIDSDQKLINLLTSGEISNLRGFGPLAIKLLMEFYGLTKGRESFNVIAATNVVAKRPVVPPADILSRLTPLVFSLRRERGIYALKSFGQIVYIGMTDDVVGRVLKHRDNGRKVFDGVYFCQLCTVSRKELVVIERAVINLIKPPLNKN